MFKNKLTTFIRFLVLAIYAIHAVSPLLYSIKIAEDAVYHPADQTRLDITDSRHISTVAAHSPSSMMRSHVDEDPVVLLKKRRAIASSSKSIIEQLSRLYPALSPLAPFDETAGIPARTTDDLPICPNGFQFFHSGISPPSV